MSPLTGLSIGLAAQAGDGEEEDEHDDEEDWVLSLKRWPAFYIPEICGKIALLEF